MENKKENNEKEYGSQETELDNNEKEKSTGIRIKENKDAFQVELEKENSEIDELGELKDKYLRLQAEFDNFRRRNLKEKNELFEQATYEIIKKMLPIIDNLERGISSKTTDVDAINKGIEMIYKQFCDFLNSIGIESIQAAGNMFDPNLHEAVICEDSNEPDGIIIDELQKGYSHKGKILRPSMVKVSGKK